MGASLAQRPRVVGQTMNQMAVRYAGNCADAAAGIESTQSTTASRSGGKPLNFVETA